MNPPNEIQISQYPSFAERTRTNSLTNSIPTIYVGAYEMKASRVRENIHFKFFSIIAFFSVGLFPSLEKAVA